MSIRTDIPRGFRGGSPAGSYFESRKNRERAGTALLTILLSAGAVLLLLPLWWMVSTSLKSMAEIMQYPPSFYPKSAHFDNYVHAWQAAPFTRYTLNTLMLAAFAVVSQALVNSFVAYGFARIRFRGKTLLFSILLGTMMIPGFVTLIPQYILFAKLHWVGTYLPLIVPGFFGGAFAIFLIRQFFLNIPGELLEAARIDGANHFYIWWRIMVPLAKPAIATVALLAFNGAWNDFLGPLLYLKDESMFTLQIGLQTFRGSDLTQWNYLMAGSVIVLLPVVLLFFLFQRYFIQGMNLSAGTKG